MRILSTRLAACAVAIAVALACGGESHHASSGAPAGGSAGTGAAMGGSGGQGTAAYGNFPTMIEDGGRTVCGPGGCVVEPFVDKIPPPGPQYCGGVECAAGEQCCQTSSTCFDPATHPEDCLAPPDDQDEHGRKTCASNADCESFEFCRADNRQMCQGAGHCMPVANCGGCGVGPDGKTQSPGLAECIVCGCDGNTYPDFQTACAAGVNTTTVPGACGVPTTIGGAGAGGAAQTATPCGTDDNCGAFERCCAITGLCYVESDPGRCQVPPPGSSYPCSSNDQCGPSEYCLGEGCSGPGGCVPRDTDDCGIRLEPVCGCDNVTYTSEACASHEGVRVQVHEACEKI